MLTQLDKEKITQLVINILNTHEITKDIIELSKEKCLIILNEIIECVKNTIDVAFYLKDIPTDDKPSVIIELVIYLLSSDELKIQISPEVRDEIQSLSNNAEAMNILLKFVNYLNSELLDSLDNNSDGKVSVEEVEADIVDILLCKKVGGCACYKEDGCCKSCPDFSKKIANGLAKFFIKILCCACEKNYIERRDT